MARSKVDNIALAVGLVIFFFGDVVTGVVIDLFLPGLGFWESWALNKLILIIGGGSLLFGAGFKAPISRR